MNLLLLSLLLAISLSPSVFAKEVACRIVAITTEHPDGSKSAENRKYCKETPDGKWQHWPEEYAQYRQASDDQRITGLRNFIEKYTDNDPDNLVPAARRKLIATEQKEQLDEYQAAKYPADFESFISKYERSDPNGLVPDAKKKIPEARAREQMDAYKSAHSSADFSAFIQRYQNSDPNKLVAKAKEMQKGALLREAEEKRAAAREAEELRRKEAYRREHACDHIYVGKVVNAPVTGLVTLFGKKSEKAIVLGVSSRHGVATVRSVDDSRMVGELPCDSL